MNYSIKEVAERLKALREIVGISAEEMSRRTDTSGDNPKLKRYCVVRKGTGLPVKRREGFEYQHLAYLFKDKKIEPFLVIAPYSEEEQEKPISLSVHEGQEYDYILSGSLKTVIDGKIKVLNAGDSIIYDSSAPHGMIATNGAKCEFLAILIK